MQRRDELRRRRDLGVVQEAADSREKAGALVAVVAEPKGLGEDLLEEQRRHVAVAQRDGGEGSGDVRERNLDVRELAVAVLAVHDDAAARGRVGLESLRRDVREAHALPRLLLRLLRRGAVGLWRGAVGLRLRAAPVVVVEDHVFGLLHRRRRELGGRRQGRCFEEEARRQDDGPGRGPGVALRRELRRVEGGEGVGLRRQESAAGDGPSLRRRLEEEGGLREGLIEVAASLLEEAALALDGPRHGLDGHRGAAVAVGVVDVLGLEELRAEARRVEGFPPVVALGGGRQQQRHGVPLREGVRADEDLRQSGIQLPLGLLGQAVPPVVVDQPADAPSDACFCLL
mmetsp:Transcript_11379/g.37397  ORF Transcript_11379/g.37397 Transcript_11379/m.37397 type:complete len:343 (+) Transcript_11379:609-1637(+)